jgi:hypothetical protein
MNLTYRVKVPVPTKRKVPSVGRLGVSVSERYSSEMLFKS